MEHLHWKGDKAERVCALAAGFAVERRMRAYAKALRGADWPSELAPGDALVQPADMLRAALELLRRDYGYEHLTPRAGRVPPELTQEAPYVEAGFALHITHADGLSLAMAWNIDDEAPG